MRNRPLSLDKFTESIASMSGYRKNLFNAKDTNYAKMIKSLKNVVEGELTEKQKLCISLYYGEKMKMKDISDKLQIGISSVSRHIKKAKSRIKKTMMYYF